MNALILPTMNIIQKNITMDQLDIDTISRLRYPVGSSYISFDPNLDPNNFLYGTWEMCQNNTSLIYGSDTDGGTVENSNIDNTKITTEKSLGSTGATNITESQIENHRHKYMYTSAIKKSSSGTEFRVVSGFSDESNDFCLAYSGSDGSHTHKLNNHTHTLNIPTTGIYLWIRKE